MSLFSNLRISLRSLFRKFLGKSIDPIKYAINPMSNVMTKLVEGGFIDKIKKIANRNSTIRGLKS